MKSSAWNTWQKLFSGYVLADRKAVMVRAYVLVIGFIDVAVGAWLGSTMLIAVGAFLVGVFMSPVLGVWKDVITAVDQAAYRRFTDGESRHVNSMLMALPFLTLILAFMLCMDHLYQA